MKKLLITIGLILTQIGSYSAEQEITAVGSSFVYPIMSQWIKEYQLKNKKVKINYQSMGSSAGVEQLKNGTVEFAATDKPIDDSILKQNHWVQKPIIKGAIIPVAHINTISSGLVLTGLVLADIYKGKITYWDEQIIKKLNPKIKLPHQRIIPIRRADSSGTTYNFTKYLSSVDSKWQKTVGVNSVVKWPGISIGAQGNAGVASQVAVLPGAIGYVEYSYAKAGHLVLVNMINNSGHIITPVNQAFNITPHGTKAWPIMATTYVVFAKKNPKVSAIKEFLAWIIKFGNKSALDLDYVPMGRGGASL